MNEFNLYLNFAIEIAQKKEQELIASDRKDEANLQKIRANIYGICRTVYEVVAKTKNGDELSEEYIKKLDNLPKNWVESYEKAKLHNDVEKILIEETKLEVLKEVKEKFEELRREQVTLC